MVSTREGAGEKKGREGVQKGLMPRKRQEGLIVNCNRDGVMTKGKREEEEKREREERSALWEIAMRLEMSLI